MKLSKTRDVFGRSTKHYFMSMEHLCNQNVALLSCIDLANQAKVVKTVCGGINFTFLTTRCPFSSLYFSSVTVCVASSGKSSTYEGNKAETHQEDREYV